MTEGGRRVTTPVPSAVGGITQEYLLLGVIPVSPEGNIPFSDSHSSLDTAPFIVLLGCLPGAFFTSQTSTALKSLS